MKKTNSDYLYVGIQFMLFAVYIIQVTVITFASGTILNLIGIILITLGILMGLLSVIQLNKNLSPFPTPITGGKLIETGLYKYIRHPIYTSILSTLLGYGLYSGSGYKILITITLLVLFFYKSKYEEKKLSSVFSEYPEYVKKTGRFLPKAL
ncbi:methyltransferase family protein [Croceibacter atlanticus]|uniref:methyltransferase family protein n=1 Tax=Croceibacter atlanticus TaxID=313588 RepID=UPI002490994F|nr:isoprenylcysteine carboxylmethyltransferase family protein [Croceibacter atlanticus]